jgi:hypothetical protein
VAQVPVPICVIGIVVLIALAGIEIGIVLIFVACPEAFSVIWSLTDAPPKVPELTPVGAMLEATTPAGRVPGVICEADIVTEFGNAPVVT